MWTLQFKDITERTVTVNIYGGDGTVALKGAAEPLVIDDGSNCDPLTPSIVSTGNLAIIDEGNINDLMPDNDLQHRVVVTVGGETSWQGFMQAKQYGRNMYVRNDVSTYAIHGVLSAMDAVDMDYTKPFVMQKLRSLINEAVASVEWTCTDVVYPQEWTSGGYGGWLDIEVSRVNWFLKNDNANEDDPERKEYTCITYKELLEAIAQFFGWTVCIQGTELWFLSRHTAKYQGINGGTYDYTMQFSLSSKQSSDFDNTRTTNGGYNSIMIDAEVNSVEDIGLSVDDKFGVYVRTKTITPSGNDNRLRSLIFDTEKGLNIYAWQINQIGSSRETEVYQTGHSASGEPSGYYIDAQLAKTDIYKQSDVDSKEKVSYSYKESLLITSNIPRYTQPGGAISPCEWEPVKVVELHGMLVPPISDGCFDLNIDINQLTGQGNGEFLAEIKVGDKWWNGNMDSYFAWDNQQHIVPLQIINGKIKVTKTIDMLYEDAAHFVIPIREAISGEVVLSLYAKGQLINESNGALEVNMSLKYCNPEVFVYKETQSNNVYTSTSSNNFKGKKNVSLKMTTKTRKCKNGFAIIYLDGQPYSATPTPEENLLSKMKDCYLNSVDTLAPTIRGYLPGYGERCYFDGSNWIVMGKRIDYRNSDVKLNLIQL